MSVNPEETAAFANILGKLDGVKKGETVVDIAAGRQQRLADNDMTAILSAFASTSGTASALTLTPEALTESAVKSDQVGAEFKPKNISPVLGEPEKDHPMKNKLVGEDSLSSIKKKLTDYLQDIKDSNVDDFYDKKQIKSDVLGPVIKTIKLGNNKQFTIHGNEDDGFRVKANDRVHSTTFDSFDQAQTACETYINKKYGK
jgi:hypothetical protein